MGLGVEGAGVGDLPAADVADQAQDRIADPDHAALGGLDSHRRRSQDRGRRQRLWLAAIAAQRKFRPLRRLDHVDGGNRDHPADPLVSTHRPTLYARMARPALPLPAIYRKSSVTGTRWAGRVKT